MSNKQMLYDALNSDSGSVRFSVADAFQNHMARLGYGQPNLNEGAAYPNTRLSGDYNLFNSMYRSSWIARKIIDVPPADMLKNWIKITSEIDPQDIRRIDKAFMKTGTRAKLLEGLKWARLYGGAVGLILIDGDEDLESPLDLDLLQPGQYRGLLVFDRWNGVIPSVSLISDLNSPDFGKPEYYTLDLNSANNNAGMLNMDESDTVIKVHHSRIIRFEGRNLPFLERGFEQGWGESELEIVFEELKKRDNTSYNIASLIFLANIRVMKMANLGQVLAAASEQAKDTLYRVLEAQNALMSNNVMLIMDKDDALESHQYTFAGINDIYESFMLDVAGAAEMPVTKIFGRSPAGLNSTGESDLTQYYETLEEKQEEYLRTVFDKLLPVVCVSALGQLPPDLDWEFNPCMTATNKDLADLTQAMATPVFDAYNSGLISRKTALKELKQQADITGMWSNITETEIEEATDDLFNPESAEEMDLTSEIYGPKPEDDLSDGAKDWKERIKALLRG